MRSVLLVAAFAALWSANASAFTETLTNGNSRDLSQSGGDAGGADGLTDFTIDGPFCSALMRFQHANLSARAFSPSATYAQMNYSEALAQSYTQVGPFCPSTGDLLYVRTAGASTGTTADDRFYKLRVIANPLTMGNVQVETRARARAPRR